MAAFTRLKALLEERISSRNLQKKKEPNGTYAASTVTPFKEFSDVHYLEL
jgi:hypothetical protein